MKKLATSILLAAAATTSFAADKVTLVTHYQPGAFMDTLLQQVKPYLESKKYDVDVVFVKSCAQAREMTMDKSNKNFMHVIMTSEVRPGDETAACVMDPKKENLDVVASLTMNSYYLCNAPGKKFRHEDLTNPAVRLGSARDSQVLLDYVLSNLPKPYGATTVPYRGGGPMRQAIAAGDVDVWFGQTGAITAFPNSECIGSTVKNDVRGYPFIGDVTGVPQLELAAFDVFLARPDGVSKEVKADLRSIAQDKGFRDFLAANKVNASLKNTEQVMDAAIKIYESTKK